jgi:hypothetical protein
LTGLLSKASSSLAGICRFDTAISGKFDRRFSAALLRRFSAALLRSRTRLASEAADAKWTPAEARRAVTGDKCKVERVVPVQQPCSASR